MSHYVLKTIGYCYVPLFVLGYDFDAQLYFKEHQLMAASEFVLW